jgi:polyhydroxyalkanoate synthesis regulator phasin
MKTTNPTVDKTTATWQEQAKPLTDAAQDAQQEVKKLGAKATDSMQDTKPLVVGAAGKFVLAAIGAIGLAQDAIEAMLERMVKRGEISQKDAKKLMNELSARRPHLRSTANSLTASMPKDLEMPSKADIKALNDQIAALSAKVDRLSTTPPEPLKKP